MDCQRGRFGYESGILDEGMEWVGRMSYCACEEGVFH